MKITVIGCGRWGSFIAWYLDKTGHDVSLYGREDSPHMKQFRESRTNGTVTLPDSIRLISRMEEAVRAELIVVSVGAQSFREVASEIAAQGYSGDLVLCMKGIEQGSGKRLSEIALEYLPRSGVAVWLGPGHVQEFVAGIPNCMVIDGTSEELKERLVTQFGSSLIRFYYGRDLIVNMFEQLQSGTTGFKRFTEIMDEPVEKDSPGAVDAGRLLGDIAFEDVSFRYKNSDARGAEKVIKHLDLHIPAGETVALVGPSGGGKTTLCNLIPRFYDPDAGRITIDGTDIRDFTRVSLRRNIGIVAQDVFLFDGSIADNIRYGDLDATEQQVIEAAKKARIHDYIMTLEDGYDTQVGERGVKLSGGQKQRISIARVFLKDPGILILDEATSALDNQTEMEIQQELFELAKGRTCIIVAHRLSTIKSANEIVVLTPSGIAERGSHRELMALGGMYANLYNYQIIDV